MNDTMFETWAPRLRSVMRVMAAFVFLAHGSQKLFAFPVTEPQPTAPLFTLFWFAGICEFFGGSLMLLGWFTRPVAFILAGEMAVAYFTRHAPGGFWPILNRGELAVLYCFLWLYLAVAGPGPWSLDALRARRSGGSRLPFRESGPKPNRSVDVEERR
ncbi:MAG: DoxX family protein [Gemmatimonadetes bacterium]|nr:DoxX family protein [Gemmatimonadota bacterium]